VRYFVGARNGAVGGLTWQMTTRVGGRRSRTPCDDIPERSRSAVRGPRNGHVGTALKNRHQVSASGLVIDRPIDDVLRNVHAATTDVVPAMAT
jgi:hypothetical protein